MKNRAAIIDVSNSQDTSMAADVGFGLVGKVLSPHLINGVTFMRVFSNILVDDRVEKFPLKTRIFLFKFSAESNVNSVLKRGPWIFDKEPLVLVRFVLSTTLGEYVFDKMTWWI
ncbi:hypothetical protein HRI_000814000 [Hibiscus trionum]|uniref:DUF4283 domain-containing protein n=1 Tax=Hibiscus trionum TaxID=183268 RepID=A0A9W7LNP8_HIBTR|nr:hypothetical protein HRI_000814000 [Hibiscus trionum]